MDKLDDSGQINVVPAGVAEGVGAHQHEQGPQAFAPAADDVVPELVDEGDIRLELVLDEGVYRLHVVFDKRSNILKVHWLLRTAVPQVACPSWDDSTSEKQMSAHVCDPMIVPAIGLKRSKIRARPRFPSRRTPNSDRFPGGDGC